VFPAFYPVLPEGRAAISYVGDFVRGLAADQGVVATAS
jgi:hypothetical protein